MKMKNLRLIVIGVLLLAAITFLWFKIDARIQSFRNGTVAMEPTLEQGAYIFTYKSRNLKSLDIVAYRGKTFSRDNVRHIFETTFIGRIMAFPFDTLEIIDGFVHVNGINVDVNLRLKRAYHLEEK